MIVTDISGARAGKFVDLATFNANTAFSAEDRDAITERVNGWIKASLPVRFAETSDSAAADVVPEQTL